MPNKNRAAKTAEIRKEMDQTASLNKPRVSKEEVVLDFKHAFFDINRYYADVLINLLHFIKMMVRTSIAGYQTIYTEAVVIAYTFQSAEVTACCIPSNMFSSIDLDETLIAPVPYATAL